MLYLAQYYIIQLRMAVICSDSYVIDVPSAPHLSDLEAIYRL